MVYIKPLSSVTEHELQAVGYKVQDLAVLRQQQIPMPSGFVILSNCLDETVRTNNLKYKIDYLMSHAQLTIKSTLQNVYSSARKALLEAKMPPGFEVELREFYDSIAVPVAVGELEAQRPAVRIIMSTTRIEDPESNESVIQTITSFEELLLGIKEAWALSYHPSLLEARMREHYPESKLRVALLVQLMDEPVTSIHTYSSLQQDHKKVYLQVYYGYPDLRNRVLKDYYAISKSTLRIVANQVRPQPEQLVKTDKELTLVPVAPTSGDKMIERDLVELARLTKKIERVLHQPVKAFFVSTKDAIELLWVNRMGFDILPEGEEPATPEPTPITSGTVETTPATPEPVEQTSAQIESDDFIAPAEGVNAKLLGASIKMVRSTVERLSQGSGSLAEMIARLNDANTFSRPVDGALLQRIEDAVAKQATISDNEYNRAIEEVTFLAKYA